MVAQRRQGSQLDPAVVAEGLGAGQDGVRLALAQQGDLELLAGDEADQVVGVARPGDRGATFRQALRVEAHERLREPHRQCIGGAHQQHQPRLAKHLPLAIGRMPAQ